MKNHEPHELEAKMSEAKEQSISENAERLQVLRLSER